MTARAAIILAAGQGTRMRSPTPKVLHKVGGRTLLDRAIDAAQALGCERVIVVAGTHSPAVAEHAAQRLDHQLDRLARQLFGRHGLALRLRRSRCGKQQCGN